MALCAPAVDAIKIDASNPTTGLLSFIHRSPAYLVYIVAPIPPPRQVANSY